MRIGPLLTRLQELESDLAEAYDALGERHAADHDVFHQCHTFAMQARQRAEALAPAARRYEEAGDVDTEPGFWSGLLETVRREASAVAGRRPESGLLLLRDLRKLFLQAEECSITWVMAAQGAQAARDAELLEVVRACHTEVEIQTKWLVTKIKTASPQALTVG